MIDAYLAELDDALRGPSRAKADLLTEARDSLVDAAQAHATRGLTREAAERHAVGEFGQVQQVAPGYQIELGLAQGRRTALLVCGILAVQHLASEYAWRWYPHATIWRPDRAYQLMAEAVNWLSIAAIVGSLLAAFGATRGVRHLGAWRGLPRAIGVFAFAVYGFFAVAAVALAALSPVARSLLTSAAGPVFVVVFWVIPIWIAASARRCLRTA